MRSARSDGAGQSRRRARRRMAGLAIGAIAILGCAREGGASSHAGSTITAPELSARIEAGRAPLILDVRSTEEYRSGHIPGAINIPYDELTARLDELPVDRDDEIVVLCQSGGRAGIAEEELAEEGYTHVRDLDGHWRGWRAAHLPSE